MKALNRFAWITSIAAYVLIFTGGLVRVSGAGLGCPDWPKCFGHWLPPTSVSQLPASIDPSLFNFTLAWIEYGNRMLGMVVGLLVLTTAILALVHARKIRRVWVPIVAAALLIAYEGWQGGQVIAAELEPLLVSVHALLAFLIASLMIYATQQLYYIGHNDAERTARYPMISWVWMAVPWGLAILQSALGTQLRAAVKLIQDAKPLGGESAWLGAVGPISHAHETLGIIVVVAALLIGFRLLLRSENPSSLVYQGGWGLVLLGLVQAVAGFAMIFGRYIPILQLIHLWGASLMVGLLLLLLGALRKNHGGFDVQF